MFTKENTSLAVLFALSSGLVAGKLTGILTWHWIIVLGIIMMITIFAAMYLVWLFMESEGFDSDDLAELDCYENVLKKDHNKVRQTQNA